MFGFGKKYCVVCGKEVEENKNNVRFGKNFCSEEHAEKYVAEQKKIENLEKQMTMDNKPQRTQRGGGCC